MIIVVFPPPLPLPSPFPPPLPSPPVPVVPIDCNCPGLHLPGCPLPDGVNKKFVSPFDVVIIISLEYVYPASTSNEPRNIVSFGKVILNTISNSLPAFCPDEP